MIATNGMDYILAFRQAVGSRRHRNFAASMRFYFCRYAYQLAKIGSHHYFCYD